MLQAISSKWLAFKSRLNPYPPILDPQEFMTGQWYVDVDHYYQNGNNVEKRKTLYMKSYRKNVGNEVFFSIYNVTDSNSNVLFRKFIARFLDENKTMVSFSSVSDSIEENLVNFTFTKDFDSSRKTRGPIPNTDCNFSLILAPNGVMPLVILNNTSQELYNIGFTRKLTESASIPLKWYHVVSIIGMFVVIGYMISQPDAPEACPACKQQKQDDDKAQDAPVKKKSDLEKKND